MKCFCLITFVALFCANSNADSGLLLHLIKDIHFDEFWDPMSNCIEKKDCHPKCVLEQTRYMHENGGIDIDKFAPMWRTIIETCTNNITSWDGCDGQVGTFIHCFEDENHWALEHYIKQCTKKFPVDKMQHVDHEIIAKDEIVACAARHIAVGMGILDENNKFDKNALLDEDNQFNFPLNDAIDECNNLYKDETNSCMKGAHKFWCLYLKFVAAYEDYEVNYHRLFDYYKYLDYDEEEED